MTFWQENYQFTKEVYDMRYTKFAEWMETLEKSISRIMADKVYTSAEFKRERDNFYVSIVNHECNLGTYLRDKFLKYFNKIPDCQTAQSIIWNI